MTEEATPEVSVILCTYERPEMLQRALRSVLAQRFDDFEVIVVDDGSTQPVVLDEPIDRRVRLLRQEHGGAGAARVAGLEAARGMYVTYCDDDDEWLPDHLPSLIGYLRENPDVPLVYGDSLWGGDDEDPYVAYSTEFNRYVLGWYNYIFATDVAHRRDVAIAAGGFDGSLSAGEDWDLWLRISRDQPLRHVKIPLSRHHWHEGAVSNQPTYDPSPVIIRHQDWERSLSARRSHGIIFEPAQRRPFTPSSWTGEIRRLIWHSMLSGHTGYAVAGRELLLALERRGVDVTVAPTKDQAPAGYDRFFKPLDDWGCVGFYYDLRLRPGALPTERTVSYSMWESSAPPEWHVKEVNRAAILQYVPCETAADIYREAGVKIPVKVLHHGVDAAAFPQLTRQIGNAFVFGTVGDLSPRKGIDLLLRAFEDEFSSSEPVRLVIKGAPGSQTYGSEDPRVVVLRETMHAKDLVALLGKMHAFVMPSRGEGFGLCGLEAMSTGLPLIATDWSGPSEYLDEAHSYPLSYELTEAGGTESNHVVYNGTWAEPDYDHLRALMRHVYEHPGEALEKGARAAEVVRTVWTWDRAAAGFIADLDEMLR